LLVGCYVVAFRLRCYGCCPGCYGVTRLLQLRALFRRLALLPVVCWLLRFGLVTLLLVGGRLRYVVDVWFGCFVVAVVVGLLLVPVPRLRVW